MPHLVYPDVRYRDSFLAALGEPDPLAAGAPFRPDSDRVDIPLARIRSDFAGYVAQRHAEAHEPPWPGAVTATALWWVEGEEYLGRVSIRHELSDALRSHGGHLGYEVRPSARGRGHATAMLRAALPWAAKLGIDPALMTCDVINVASRRVIEKSGGSLVDEDGETCWYHLPTGASG
ncbi:GNAT family N-acetyltransferase [Lipingzhangella sp. LS1_29]|uniref:GNAT family N-acetyltransferase n=1 Tax=Lipingzhangella rawalii TaxID=2055835 RepID=A0ABU2H7Q3_9ACTN|nr:GNAT family N-acetyltransferase [Lipingzhangella rawalii]MDS1271332.1 GNAT family N-acetyltransferase [Lipingzhangella rawalii]